MFDLDKPKLRVILVFYKKKFFNKKTKSESEVTKQNYNVI